RIEPLRPPSAAAAPTAETSVEHRKTKDRFNWRLVLFGTSVTLSLCVLDALLESDGLLYLILIVPLATLVFIPISVIVAFSKRPLSLLSIMSTLAIFWILSFTFLKNHFVVRNIARWALRAGHYKAEVMAQPDPKVGELKHIEWDGWGFA